MKNTKKATVYVDALGREVPAAYVPKDKKEKDAAARKVLGWWLAEEKRLAKLWEETRKVVEKMHAGARKAEGLSPVSCWKRRRKWRSLMAACRAMSGTLTGSRRRLSTHCCTVAMSRLAVACAVSGTLNCD